MPDSPPPTDVIEEAVRLSRLAHRATTGATDRETEAAEYRRHRDALLTDHGYTARIRNDDHPTLVIYPQDWLSDGTIDPASIEDTDAAIERPLDGADEPDYETAAAQNQATVDEVAADHGPVHAANAAAFAAFMNNHRARPIATATGADIEEFLTEYYPRNTWPTTKQRATIVRSLRYTIAAATDD